mmetsp:Transcript_115059/g.330566  ORF Transcript_115059/g.330566 Transcript_115059/m.330566 type:complete len:229 (-) Transcript_115059:520-1206(-)
MGPQGFGGKPLLRRVAAHGAQIGCHRWRLPNGAMCQQLATKANHRQKALGAKRLVATCRRRCQQSATFVGQTTVHPPGRSSVTVPRSTRPPNRLPDSARRCRARHGERGCRPVDQPPPPPGRGPRMLSLRRRTHRATIVPKSQTSAPVRRRPPRGHRRRPPHLPQCRLRRQCRLPRWAAMSSAARSQGLWSRARRYRSACVSTAARAPWRALGPRPSTSLSSTQRNPH